MGRGREDNGKSECVYKKWLETTTSCARLSLQMRDLFGQHGYKVNGVISVLKSERYLVTDELQVLW